VFQFPHAARSRNDTSARRTESETADELENMMPAANAGGRRIALSRNARLGVPPALPVCIIVALMQVPTPGREDRTKSAEIASTPQKHKVFIG
jgi:hypothetical protein